jgi:hypothetical protein
MQMTTTPRMLPPIITMRVPVPRAELVETAALFEAAAAVAEELGEVIVGATIRDMDVGVT